MCIRLIIDCRCRVGLAMMRCIVSLLSLLSVSVAVCAKDDAKHSVGIVRPDSLAQNVDSLKTDDMALDLDAVVVTGTLTPKPLKSVPVITRLITSADIRRSDATNIGDLLQSELPGIEFSYSMNQQTSLNIQGFGGNSVLFLVDGERLAGETLDNIDYARLNLDNVARVEIVKGAASSLYGSNAVGGVVNLISKIPDEPVAANVNARFGAYGSRRYGASLSVMKGRVGSVTNVQYTCVDSISLTDGNPDKGDYGKIYGHSIWNVKERLIYLLNDRLRFTGRAGYFFRQRNSQVAVKERYRDFTGGLKGNFDMSDGAKLEVSYAFDQYDKSDYQVETRYDVRDYSNVQHNVTARYSKTLFGFATLTGGGDFMRDYLMSYQFADNGSKRQYVADGYIQADLGLSPNFDLLGGARYDYYSEASVSHVSSKLAFMHKMRRFTLRGSYAGGFRAPTLKEMYMNFNMANIFMIYGNPDLKSETSHNFSLSGEYARHRYNFTLTGFFNMVDNRISTAWNTVLRGQQYVNMSRMNISGLEANAVMALPEGLGLRLSYSFTHEHIKKGAPMVSSTRPHTATIKVDYNRKFRNYGLYVALNGRMLSSVTVDEFTSVTSYESTQRVTYPSYAMWKLIVNQSVWRGVSLNVTVDNLFNYRPEYYYSNSPSTTGTTLAVGLSIDIDKMVKRGLL